MTFRTDDAASRQMRTVTLGNFASGGTIGECDSWDVVDVAQTAQWQDLTIDAPTSGLSVNKTVRNTGTVGFFIYGRYIRPAGAHTFTYVPGVGFRRTAAGPQRIVQTSVDVTLPTNTSTNAAFQFVMPPVLGLNGIVHVEWFAVMTSNANTKTFALNVNDGTTNADVFSGNMNNAVRSRGFVRVGAMNSNTAQQSAVQYQAGSTVSSNAQTTLNFAVPTTWTFNVTKATGSDSVVIAQHFVELIRFD